MDSATNATLEAPIPRSPEDSLSVTSIDATDEALMARFNGGDRAAFVTLVRRHQTRLYNFAFRHVRSAAAAEEVVQDTFVRVLQNAREFTPTSRFVAWAHSIARNLCIDALRKAAHRKHPSLDDTTGRDHHGNGEGAPLANRMPDEKASVENAIVSTEIRERVISAVAELPEEQREVFLLREISDLSFREIAEIVGAPENTVKSRMRYALERLQSTLSAYEEYARALR